MKVKVCGMREPGNIQEIAAMQPDYFGFIFFQGSKRYAAEHIDQHFISGLPGSIKKVGVFVNEGVEEIKRLTHTYGFDLVQLHGRETPLQCKELKDSGLQVVKAFSVDESFDFHNILPYESSCNFFLFDTRGKNYGGNGVTFDWKLLQNYTSDIPYFLSGGLNLENIRGINNLKLKPFAIDVNSGFELEPGLKDVQAIKELLELRNQNQL
ncbi:phosphoribosylanthranilate isomerase [Pontibacter silvestris]|uniref:N-(5'-phosphoribosyl)anthranilate isomerase n=1 Tax=Pontibacter silvestris TaxID=2305183 RepID=A0ABW4WZH1_9BACT|nr:phosphoribosylanthranilate isomerase [Pontibacter silvestris]MCC9135301.1 phosphoribosylanthranilate isomerase [Pontibacter silvestris]